MMTGTYGPDPVVGDYSSRDSTPSPSIKFAGMTTSAMFVKSCYRWRPSIEKNNLRWRDLFLPFGTGSTVFVAWSLRSHSDERPQILVPRSGSYRNSIQTNLGDATMHRRPLLIAQAIRRLYDGVCPAVRESCRLWRHKIRGSIKSNDWISS